MNGLNYKNEQVELTGLESEVYEAVKFSDGMEDCYCAHPEEISDNTGIPMKQIRGVMSSLVKKKVAYVDELVEGCGDWIILHEEVTD